MNFDYKVESGKIYPSSITISFDSEHTNEQLVKYVLAMEFLRRGATSVKEDKEMKESEKLSFLKYYEGDYEELKQRLLNNQEVVKTEKDIFDL